MRPPDPAPPAIRTLGLTKRFGARPAVDGVGLRVPAGQITGFLGPNGAGKSTTIAMLLGLTHPTAGRIELFGLDAARHRAAVQRRIGALLETPAFYPHLSARETLFVLCRLARLDPAVIPPLLERVGLGAAAREPVGRFSLGQRQRLGLATALLGAPDLLILDEPTNGLDPAALRQVHALLCDFAAAGGTVFLSSHRLEEVRTLCGHVAILSRGRLVAQGPVADLLAHDRGGGLLLRVTEPERARALLAGAAWEVSLTHDSAGPLLRVHVAPERAIEVSALLAAHAIGVAELRPEQPALEDLFLTLTGASRV